MTTKRDADGYNEPTRLPNPFEAGAGTADHGRLYSRLLDRYRPAYKVASDIHRVGLILSWFGGLLWVAGVAGLVGWHVGYDWWRSSFGVALGFLAVLLFVAASLLRLIASLLRVALDGTAFTAPGLDEQERIDLAFQAGGEDAPKLAGSVRARS